MSTEGAAPPSEPRSRGITPAGGLGDDGFDDGAVGAFDAFPLDFPQAHQVDPLAPVRFIEFQGDGERVSKVLWMSSSLCAG